ncbi:hypothetical protein Bpfe_000782, partial [Biomphalaria pfeifferi]
HFYISRHGKLARQEDLDGVPQPLNNGQLFVLEDHGLLFPQVPYEKLLEQEDLQEDPNFPPLQKVLKEENNTESSPQVDDVKCPSRWDRRKVAETEEFVDFSKTVRHAKFLNIKDRGALVSLAGQINLKDSELESQQLGFAQAWPSTELLNDEGELVSQREELKKKGYKGYVIIYSMLDCPSCTQAKLALYDANVPFIDVRLDIFPKEKYKVAKVPDIYFNEVHIGGLKDLLQLIKNRKRLNVLIQKIRNDEPGSTAPIPPYPFQQYSLLEAKPDQTAAPYFELLNDLLKKKVIRTNRMCCRRYQNSFQPDSLFTYATNSGDRANVLGQFLLNHRVGRLYNPKESYDATKSLYVQFEKSHTLALNWGVSSTLVMRGGDTVLNVIEHVRFNILQLYTKYVSHNGKIVDYTGMEESKEFLQFTQAMGALIFMNIEDMTDPMKLAFFINIYNALVIHGFIVKGFPLNSWDTKMFFRKTKYLIGRQLYSLNDLEYGVLKNKSYISGCLKYLSKKDPRLNSALKQREPLIHFALVRGTQNSPSLRIYSPEASFIFSGLACIDEQLQMAAASFLQEGGCVLDKTTGKPIIRLSSILKKNYKDFGCSKRKILGVVLQYMLNDKHKSKLEEIYKSGKYSLKFMQDNNAINAEQSDQ